MDSCPDIKDKTHEKSTNFGSGYGATRNAWPQFGTINIKTGEVQTGYFENGQMKYRRDPWWKRLFTDYSKNILKDEFVGTARGEQTGFPLSVYKTINIVTGGIVSVWGQSRFHGRVDFDVEAFIRCDELVPI